MDEAILIEIAQRFRKLEDAVANNIGNESFARILIDEKLEACRDDMVAMQEAIRRAACLLQSFVKGNNIER